MASQANQEIKLANEYIKLHKIDSLIKEMLHTVVEENSEDPLLGMISYLVNGVTDKDLELAGIKLDRSKLKAITPKPLIKDFFFNQNSALLIKKFLTPNVFEKIKNVKTEMNGSIAHLIEVANKLEGKETVGILSTDSECYSKFSPLYTPAIEFLHLFDAEKALFSNNYDIGINNIEINNEKFLGFKIRLSRNIKDYPYNPYCPEEGREEIKNKILLSLNSHFNEGKFYDTEAPEFNRLKDIFFDKELNLVSSGCKLIFSLLFLSNYK